VAPIRKAPRAGSRSTSTRASEWAVIYDAGHAMAWEQPGAFNDKVLDFLRRH